MNSYRLFPLFLLCSVLPIPPASAQDPVINPVPREKRTAIVREWDFDTTVEGWSAQSQCSLTAADGHLRIQATGNDPFFHAPVDVPGGRLRVDLRVRGGKSTVGSVFWTTDRQPHRGEDKRADFEMPANGEWLTTSARFTAPGRLTDLRIDPGTQPGRIEIDWIRLVQEHLHPLTVSSVRQRENQVDFEVTNHEEGAVTFRAAEKEYTLPGNQTLTVSKPVSGKRPLESITIRLRHADWPPVHRTAWVVNPDAEAQWLQKSMGTATLSIASDGSVAVIREANQLLATLGPLVTIDGELPQLELVEKEDNSVRFQGAGVSMGLDVGAGEIKFEVESEQPCEGPVVRAAGGLEQGLFAGLEYLGKGEHSSSKLDITTEEHIRFAPDPLKVTMPLMAFVTDRASVALTWKDMTLQPVYATPNFFDGTDDHRMTLQGRSIHATVRVAHDPLVESIAWAAAKKGLPELPAPPRTKEEQREICLAALNGPLQNEKGWGHCVQERWERRPYSDMASTTWRLGGDVPEFDRFAYGGAHIRNGTIYFVTGRGQQWLDIQRQEARKHIQRQQPDGSYRYQGKYARGHFEDTASGVCALPAARLLEFAYVTGDQEALKAGLRTLEYMKRFRTPRGAQVWECPLHTPDQLASAYLVWAYTRGFELTGRQDYLKEARKWALSGLPFTYLWSQYPIMRYATPPVYGATNWVAPNWMGLPVQWVGMVYAYALTRLAPHEDTMDWDHVARGILISGQQQQYPEGPYIGLLPDSFNIRHQRRQPADINPCALVSLRMALDNEVDFLSVDRDGNTVVAAPFPVSIGDGVARIAGRKGVSYQVLINGQELLDVESSGQDVVPLNAGP
ncbi:MAG: hypothetical protein ACQESR_20715 [Planctomycetota bacterium]